MSNVVRVFHEKNTRIKNTKKYILDRSWSTFCMNFQTSWLKYFLSNPKIAVFSIVSIEIDNNRKQRKLLVCHAKKIEENNVIENNTKENKGGRLITYDIINEHK